MTLIRKGGVQALVQRPDPKLKCAVIHGPDRAAVSETAGRLLAQLTPDAGDPFTVSLLADADLDADRLLDELSARALSGRRRIVRLRLVADAGTKDRVLQQVLQDHLDTDGSDAFLIVDCPGLDKRSGFRKLAEASDEVAAVALYEDEKADIGRLAREMIEAAGLQASAPVLGALTQRLPRDRGGARQALESLILFAGAEGGQIRAEDIEAVLSVDLGAVVNDVAASAFSGQVDRTVAALRRARFLGESGPALLRSLALHRSRLARAKTAVESGASAQTAVKSAGVFWKEEQEVMAQLGAWRSLDLQVLQATLTAADIACKTANAPDELIAHNCALDIAMSASKRFNRSGVR